MNKMRCTRLGPSDFSIDRILANNRIGTTDVYNFKPTDYTRYVDLDKRSYQSVPQSDDCDIGDNFLTETHDKSAVHISSNMEIASSDNKYKNIGRDMIKPRPVEESEQFSIKCSADNNTNFMTGNSATVDLTWLQYTRYRPPKLPRKSSIRKCVKRRPGIYPRVPFSSFQLQVLEDYYKRNAYLSRKDVLEVSTSLRLPENRIKIWFQNRRARERRESRNS